jgi:membrane protease YdiL (CAAX protease family)
MKTGSMQVILEVVWASILALLIIAIAGGIWGTLFTINLSTSPNIPWSEAVMAVVLWLMWQYLGGRFPPQRTSQERRLRLRANPVAGRVFIWAFVAGLLWIPALAGYWILSFNLVKMSGNVLPDLTKYPLIALVLVAIMGSLVSPISEEAAVRGYLQVFLERRFAVSTAILISAFVFALAHLTQGLWLPKLFVYFMGGLAFGVTAYLTKSILPGIAVHILADLTFFTTVWPYDTARPLVWVSGPDVWFWVHLAQALIFTVLAVLAFRQLAKAVRNQQAGSTGVLETEPARSV